MGVPVDKVVDFCITGKEALELIKNAYSDGIQYKVIITDFQMPIMDGLEATMKIREFLTNEMDLEREEQPKIIGVTGHVTSEFQQLGMQHGMDDVLAKPMYFSILKNIMVGLNIIQGK